MNPAEYLKNFKLLFAGDGSFIECFNDIDLKKSLTLQKNNKTSQNAKKTP